MRKFIGITTMLIGILLLLAGAFLDLYEPAITSDTGISTLINITENILLMTFGGCLFGASLTLIFDD